LVCILLTTPLRRLHEWSADDQNHSRSIRAEGTLLFCYVLLRRNAAFHDFLVARTDLDLFLVPLLEILYTHSTASGTPTGESHFRYILLSILGFLSEDASFVQACLPLVRLSLLVWWRAAA
jgi:Dyggve-Melchior-Clausen syndrome protein